MSNNIENLEQLVKAVEQARIDIAPSYLEYMPLAFAVANDCGEAGRELFHRLCRLSDKYRYEDAEKLFTDAVQKRNGKNSLGTVFHLAEAAGVDVKKLSFIPPLPSHVRSTYNAPQNEADVPNETDNDETSLPPALPVHSWPRFLQQMTDCAESTAQRDILLLGALTVLGATLNSLVRFNYGHKDHFPCLQTFILALPASGKGALTWARRLAEPLHDEMLAAYQQKMKVYNEEKTKWDYMGKERTKYPEPQQPPMKLFFIAGDNSGTGMQENLTDNEGTGLICESEADTVSTAIGSDYGHWSHTLRKAFDHDRLSYNRRTNHEYRECAQLKFSVLLSGTPAQLRPLIPSPENGLFSRQLFYYMPAINEWVNQFDTTGEDYGLLFYQWGKQWKTLLAAIKAETAGFRFELSPRQQNEFNLRMAQLFSHAGTAHGSHMRSTVARIGINMCRILCIVALLRSLDNLPAEEPSDGSCPSMAERLLACPGVAPCADTPRENTTDGMAPSLILTVDESDFEAVMNLTEPLYRHSCHVLMFLPDSTASKRQASPQEIFLSSLPMHFTRKEAMEMARRNGIAENTFDTLLRRMTQKGTIESTGRGRYRFSARIRVKGEGA